MSGLSHKLPVLLEALLFIAFNASQVPVGGKRLAEALDVSPRYLEPLLQALARSGALRSLRGPNGGYQISAAACSLPLTELLSPVLESREEERRCVPSAVRDTLIAPVFDQARCAYLDAIARVTLDDLCAKVRAQEFTEALQIQGHGDAHRLDYSI